MSTGFTADWILVEIDLNIRIRLIFWSLVHGGASIS
jgi:hypothetical protein